MTLDQLLNLYRLGGCHSVYIKPLAPNDNSKNQVYLGGSFDLLNVFPISNIRGEEAGSWVRNRFKADFPLKWIKEDGRFCSAPGTQLVLYPKYPEVRLSGFLQNCEAGPTELMTQRLSGRLLFLGITDYGDILGYVCAPNSGMANEFHHLDNLQKFGVFSIIHIQYSGNSKDKLLEELRRIHQKGWMTSKRLNSNGQIIGCTAPNCGGYTLEAELGITPNGFAEPDFLGWEIKQFHTLYWNNISSSVITLITPEPTGGTYHDTGVDFFIRQYGYDDRMGRQDRLNFGGIHRVGFCHPITGLRLELTGFDPNTGKILSPNGVIALVDKQDHITASWSFASLLTHWNRKHHQACYVPSQSQKDPVLQYRFGRQVLLGEGTDFILFLKQMYEGTIYYDPGIKMEHVVMNHPKIKRRSQFRIQCRSLESLYKDFETVYLE